jgi:hypothetical protein
MGIMQWTERPGVRCRPPLFGNRLRAPDGTQRAAAVVCADAKAGATAYSETGETAVALCRHSPT